MDCICLATGHSLHISEQSTQDEHHVWFDAPSRIHTLPFLPTSKERSSGLGDFVFNHPAPAAASVLGRPTGLVTDTEWPETAGWGVR